MKTPPSFPFGFRNDNGIIVPLGNMTFDLLGFCGAVMAKYYGDFLVRCKFDPELLLRHTRLTRLRDTHHMHKVLPDSVRSGQAALFDKQGHVKPQVGFSLHDN